MPHPDASAELPFAKTSQIAVSTAFQLADSLESFMVQLRHPNVTMARQVLHLRHLRCVPDLFVFAVYRSDCTPNRPQATVAGRP